MWKRKRKRAHTPRTEAKEKVRKESEPPLTTQQERPVRKTHHRRGSLLPTQVKSAKRKRRDGKRDQPNKGHEKLPLARTRGEKKRSRQKNFRIIPKNEIDNPLLQTKQGERNRKGKIENVFGLLNMEKKKGLGHE